MAWERSVSRRRDHFDLVPVRIVDIERAHALEHRMDAGSYPHPGPSQALLQLLVSRAIHAKRKVMEDSLGLLARELDRSVRMRHQHDHLGHPGRTFARTQKFVWQLWRRDDLEAEHVPVKMERRLDVAHPQHDLRETRNPTHAASAVTIAARLTSLARGGTEHPGARSKPRPPASSTARRASVSTSCGGP